MRKLPKTNWWRELFEKRAAKWSRERGREVHRRPLSAVSSEIKWAADSA